MIQSDTLDHVQLRVVLPDTYRPQEQMHWRQQLQRDVGDAVVTDAIRRAVIKDACRAKKLLYSDVRQVQIEYLGNFVYRIWLDELAPVDI